MTTEEIIKLPKIVRLAGYLSNLAKLDEYGAKLRTKYDKDESWTREDEKEWDDLCDLNDPWHYALSSEEHQLLEPIVLFMSCLCRGEDPSENIKLTYELLPTGKYGNKK